MNSISRIQFLRGDWLGKYPETRPPWALPEPAFSTLCDGCAKCERECEQKIIFISDSNLPQLDFSRSGCTFCAKCVEACETGALHQSPQDDSQPWQLQAELNNTCLAKNGINCARCIEECEHQAIVSKPTLAGRAIMQINETVCTGCGMCIKTCPVSAISLQKPVQNLSLSGEHK